jgi:hypothetical protein
MVDRGDGLHLARLVVDNDERSVLRFKILPSPAHTTNTAGIIGMTRQLALNTASISCWFSFARSGFVR